MTSDSFPGFVRRISQAAVLMLVLPSCVVSKQEHDALLQRYQNEVDGRARSERDLAASRLRANAAEKELASLTERVQQQEQVLDDTQRLLAQSQFDVAVKERDGVAAQELVVQLRGELGRVAEHLRAYAKDKDELSQQQADLSQQVEHLQERLNALKNRERSAQRRLSTLRYLLLQLQPEIQNNGLDIRAKAGDLQLTVETTRLFAPKTRQLTNEGRRLLNRVGKVLAKVKPQLELFSEPQLAPKTQTARLRAAAQALVSGGLPFERVSFALPAESSPAASEKRDQDQPSVFGIRLVFSPEDGKSLAGRNPQPARQPSE